MDFPLDMQRLIVAFIIIILHFMCSTVLGKQEQCHTILPSAPVSLTILLSPMASLYD